MTRAWRSYHPSFSRGSPQGWRAIKESNGIRIFQYESDENAQGIHVFRSCTTSPVHVSFDCGFAEQLLMDTTDKLRATYPQFDPSFLDGQVRCIVLQWSPSCRCQLCTAMPLTFSRQVLSVLERDGLQLCTLKWCVFKTPPVVWNRDFVFLDYVDPNVTDTTGHRCAVAAVVSVPRPEVPEFAPSVKCTRGQILCSGYVTRQLSPTTCEIHFIAQVAPTVCMFRPDVLYPKRY